MGAAGAGRGELRADQGGGMESRIYFIRHGITEGNMNKWFYGRLDLPLTEKGKELLRGLAEMDIYPDPEKAALVGTSCMIRTEETLEIVCGRIAHEVFPKLREFNFGVFDGKTLQEIRDKDYFVNYINDETGDFVIPEGDSNNRFSRRVMRGVAEVLKCQFDRCGQNDAPAGAAPEHPGSCDRADADIEPQEFAAGGGASDISGQRKEPVYSIIICHGGVISRIMRELFPEAGFDRWEWIPDPGLGFCIHFDGYKATGYEKIGKGITVDVPHWTAEKEKSFKSRAGYKDGH